MIPVGLQCALGERARLEWTPWRRQPIETGGSCGRHRSKKPWHVFGGAETRGKLSAGPRLVPLFAPLIEANAVHPPPLARTAGADKLRCGAGQP
ncbi:hypothetical protein MRX96_013281 [Rhipicephalus microplus]